MPEPFPPCRDRTPIGLATLGAEARAEWRADEAMWAAAAAQRWVHARHVEDVVRQYAARGDRVSVRVAQRTFEGTVVAVGEDRIDVATVSDTVSVHTAFAAAGRAVRTPFTIQRSRRSRSGGCRLPTTSVSFRARLLELEGPDRSVRLGAFVSGVEYVGPILVGEDHVVVGHDAPVLVPSAWVAYVAADPGVGAA